jgi:hypothetical protein
MKEKRKEMDFFFRNAFKLMENTMLGKVWKYGV